MWQTKNGNQNLPPWLVPNHENLGLGSWTTGGLMFCCVFFWHFAALYLRDGWADRPETFTHDWKCGHLDFGGLKCGASPKIFFGVNGLGAKSWSLLGRLPPNFAKRCELGGTL